METTTALTLVLPNKYHEMINNIRKQYDKAYPRWMPHINFMFPFVAEERFDEIRKRLVSELVSFGSFELELNEVGYFKQGKNFVTMHLKPKDPSQLQSLFKVIKLNIPEVDVKHKEFTPHLTIGQFPIAEADIKLKEYQKWLSENPITYNVTNICILNRSKTDNSLPFEIYHPLSLQ